MTRVVLSCRQWVFPLLLLTLGGCAANGMDAEASDMVDFGDELPIGEAPQGDALEDSAGWTYATQCKPIPNVPTLVNPRIIASLEGQTLHLIDDATGYDEVFPIGPGAIDTKPGSRTFGESLSYYPLVNGKRDFVMRRADRMSCAIWHKESGQPLFAGLPFMSWAGPYGIHGPIDNFNAPNGGSLRRGFVSHGCLRMEAADVLEVFARLRAAGDVPVHVQREPERLSDGSRVDIETKWIGSECTTNDECNFDGGECRINPISNRGFCTKTCSTTCPDLAGAVGTFCAADSASQTGGFCVPRVDASNPDCRTFGDFRAATARRPSGGASAQVCLPASRGLTGDACSSTTDCKDNAQCLSGVCAPACTTTCNDYPGSAINTCIASESFSAAPACARTCSPQSNADECAANTACTEVTHVSGAPRFVCTPAADE